MNDERVRKMVANGAIPTIESLIEKNKSGNESLYGTILEIGRICDTYHQILQTGNFVECAKVINHNEDGIELLELSQRTYNSLKRCGINTIPELLCMTEKELYELHYVGKGSITELKKALNDKGYVLKGDNND